MLDKKLSTPFPLAIKDVKIWQKFCPRYFGHVASFELFSNWCKPSSANILFKCTLFYLITIWKRSLVLERVLEQRVGLKLGCKHQVQSLDLGVTTAVPPANPPTLHPLGLHHLPLQGFLMSLRRKRRDLRNFVPSEHSQCREKSQIRPTCR